MLEQHVSTEPVGLASSFSRVWPARVRAYVELMKPELTGLSVLTTLCGYYLAVGSNFDTLLFLLLAVGTTMVGGGIGALNQYLEHTYDAKMKRTERRPLPTNRISPRSARMFGSALTAGGVVLLGVCANPLTMLLALATVISYLFIYTPLKRRTVWSTAIGGIPGALPPLIGWTAAANEVTWGGLAFAGILFFWQMPHFYSLAWIYRKDYSRAGYRILSVASNGQTRTVRQCLFFLTGLLPLGASLTVFGVTGPTYLVGSIVLGLAFLGYGLHFAWTALAAVCAHVPQMMNQSARRLFFASLLYLPALMLLTIVDRL